MNAELSIKIIGSPNEVVKKKLGLSTNKTSHVQVKAIANGFEDTLF